MAAHHFSVLRLPMIHPRPGVNNVDGNPSYPRRWRN
jgi:hypothetical protein